MVSSDEIAEQIYLSLGNALKTARENRGHTQAYVSQQVGLNRTSINNIEHGRQRIQVHTLYALANTLGVSPKDLLPEPAPGTGPVLYEDELDLFPQDLMPEEAVWINSVLSATAGQGPTLSDEETLEIRQCFPHTALTRAGIKSRPVPIDDIARRCGFHVIGRPYNGPIAGMRSSRRHVIGLNSLHSPERQRFTLAVVMAHFLTMPSVNPQPIFFARQLEFKAEDILPLSVEPIIKGVSGQNLVQYAMALLMPQTLIDRDLKGLRIDLEDDAEVTRLAGLYGVSRQLMTLRLFTPMPEELVHRT